MKRPIGLNYCLKQTQLTRNILKTLTINALQ